VTDHSLVGTNIAEQSAASIVSATLNNSSSKALDYMALHCWGPPASYWLSWEFQMSHLQALEIHFVWWRSYLKRAELTLTWDTCWHCHWGKCRGVSFGTRVQLYCRAPPRPFPHIASSLVKFLLQISNIFIGWNFIVKEGWFISNAAVQVHRYNNRYNEFSELFLPDQYDKPLELCLLIFVLR
jgi:hypothetical protein